jgi:hypothetical protein
MDYSIIERALQLSFMTAVFLLKEWEPRATHRTPALAGTFRHLRPEKPVFAQVSASIQLHRESTTQPLPPSHHKAA